MHLEILVEDISSGKLLEALLPKILGTGATAPTYRIKAYKGIGHLPKGLKPRTDAKKRILLDQLPKILSGYGRAMRSQSSAVIVVVDQDRRNCRELKKELLDMLSSCDPRPTTLFRIAIEEMEAWLLGDRQALEKAYPKAKTVILDKYVQDSVCGTWELLADALYPGGAAALKKKGYYEVGAAKIEWSERIGLNIDLERNQSKSFQVFKEGLHKLVNQ